MVILWVQEKYRNLNKTTLDCYVMILRVFVCRLGGYVTHTTKFYPQDGSMEPFSVVLSQTR